MGNPNVTNDPKPMSGVADRASDAVQQAKNKISEFGSAAADRIEQNRVAAASGLAGAADTLHQRADHLPGGPRVTNLAHSAAEKLNATADYVRQKDLNSLMGDVETMVKRNPGPSLAFAAALGFLIGRSFSGSRS